MNDRDDQRVEITNEDELLRFLDRLLDDRRGQWWDRFYADRERPCPFFTPDPDENLVEYFLTGRLGACRALDLGCGPGRNAVFLARNGCRVTAVDFSAAALAWAEERAREAGVEIEFVEGSIFELPSDVGRFGLIQDSGCFHHLPPHRRLSYLDLVERLLEPGGWLSLTCFDVEGGSGLSDHQVYVERRLGGGLGYSEAGLRRVFEGRFDIVELRPMRKAAPGSGRFGEPLFWTSLMRLSSTRKVGSGKSRFDVV